MGKKFLNFKQQLDRIVRSSLREKKVLNFEEFCLYVGISSSFAYRLIIRHAIPHSQPNGKEIYFDRELVDLWILRNPIKPFTQEAQEKIVFDYLLTHVASASMVTDATGVPQKCVTRYKRKLERMGLLKQIKRDRCKITGRMVWYLTTNKDLFSKRTLQLTMFNLWKPKIKP